MVASDGIAIQGLLPVSNLNKPLFQSEPKLLPKLARFKALALFDALLHQKLPR